MAIKRTQGEAAGRVDYEGAVISGPHTGTRFLMSDYGLARYAMVWDGERVRSESVGVTDIGPGCDYLDEVEVDATPEVLALAKAWEAAEYERKRFERGEREARAVARGKVVRVVRGRKVKLGTIGLVFWVGDRGFGPRVGMNVEGVEGAVWTAASNVEVVLPAVGEVVDFTAKGKAKKAA